MKDQKTNTEKKLSIPTPTWRGPVREIIIQTDGSGIFVAKDETSGTLELMAVLTRILQRISK